MTTDEPTMSFRGEYFFLSNFYPHPFIWEGEEWATSEHAYQASKTLDPSERDQIRATESAGKVKRMGRRKEDGGIVTLRSDWNAVRVAIMYSILEAKFSVPEIEEKLLSTGNIRIVEGNTWGDTFWGVDVRTGLGQNVLGKLLMRIRDEKSLFG